MCELACVAGFNRDFYWPDALNTKRCEAILSSNFLNNKVQSIIDTAAIYLILMYSNLLRVKLSN